MTSRLLILADDLTGSNDAGVQFAKRGIKSIVFIDHSIAELPPEAAPGNQSAPHFAQRTSIMGKPTRGGVGHAIGYWHLVSRSEQPVWGNQLEAALGAQSAIQVVVVNTESRHVEPAEAARRVRQVAELGLRSGATHFFKKTDSTLRGNIGAELQALMEATGVTSLPFVPAFPEMGRTTRNGIHYVHGVPIAESEFANDPLSPVRESEVVKVLQQPSRIAATSATLANRTNMKGEMNACVVFDCESREDLRAIAAHFRDQDQLRVLAGSAAFAEELPDLLPFKVEREEKVVAEEPILFVNGSLNPRALEQVARVRDRFHTIRLSPDDVFAGFGTAGRISIDPAWRRMKFEAGQGNVLLDTLENRDEEKLFRQRAAELGIAESAIHLRVADGIGRAVQELLAEGGFATLVVFGGDTLMGIARAMGWRAFVPRTEVAAGISVAQPM